MYKKMFLSSVLFLGFGFIEIKASSDRLDELDAVNQRYSLDQGNQLEPNDQLALQNTTEAAEQNAAESVLVYRPESDELSRSESYYEGPSEAIMISYSLTATAVEIHRGKIERESIHLNNSLMFEKHRNEEILQTSRDLCNKRSVQNSKHSLFFLRSDAMKKALMNKGVNVEEVLQNKKSEINVTTLNNQASGCAGGGASARVNAGAGNEQSIFSSERPYEKIELDPIDQWNQVLASSNLLPHFPGDLLNHNEWLREQNLKEIKRGDVLLQRLINLKNEVDEITLSNIAAQAEIDILVQMCTQQGLDPAEFEKIASNQMRGHLQPSNNQNPFVCGKK